MFDPLSTAISVMAIIIAGLSWYESYKRGRLLENIASSLKFIATSPKGKTSKGNSRKSQLTSDVLNQQIEERKRLKLQLEQEKLNWQKQKDLAKAIGWIADRLDTDEEDED